MASWPNFFIAGAGKSGTTTLYEYLNQIPGISMSTEKEPDFFQLDFKKLTKEEYEEKCKKYLENFSNVRDEKIVGEASGYLQIPYAAKSIHEKVPYAKILFSLRDPVERAFSHYAKHIRSKTFATFFEEIQKELKYGQNPQDWGIRLDIGMYYKNIKSFLDIFPKDQIKILIFEDWINDPKSAIDEILKFLDLNYEIKNFTSVKANTFRATRNKTSQKIFRSKISSQIARSIMPDSLRIMLRDKILYTTKKPVMAEKERTTLIEYYKEDVKNLQSLLGKELPWKNFQKYT